MGGLSRRCRGQGKGGPVGPAWNPRSGRGGAYARRGAGSRPTAPGQSLGFDCCCRNRSADAAEPVHRPTTKLEVRGVAVSEEKRYPQLGAEPSAQMLTANLARSVISLPMARQAAERILAGLRAKAGRSKRRRRMDNLQRWSSGEPTVSEPKSRPEGRRRQSGGMLRTLVQAASGEGQLPDRNIRDHHTLKQQYVAYRAKECLALKASEDEAWRRAWGQEQATRQQEIDRLRRSEQVKRTLIIEGLQPGRFRRIWLEGLKLRCRFKRDRLKKCQAERWVTIRSEWIANRIKEQPLGYKKWLRESAVADPVAARQYAWIDSMDARRAVGMVTPAAQGAEHDERLMGLSDPETALPG